MTSGSFDNRLVEAHDVTHAVGLILSVAQQRWATDHADQGAEVLLQSWEDHVPDRPYDAVVSTGAFEHFARAGLSRAAHVQRYRTFFRFCRRVLKPGGYLAVQTMGMADEAVSADARRSDRSRRAADVREQRLLRWARGSTRS